ncbi:MAG: leucine-rich repeat domain-containing protein, partial [Planctomycetes bacterium]|nr:leucine-rich repeat domain-containing protein [Planctomycetota bacterium]
ANQISDISPLQGLTSLAWLRLASNQISDVSPLKGLTSLTYLGLLTNKISDISPLQGLTSLTELSFGSNKISDGSFLARLPGLTSLDLTLNRITDWSFLAELPRLTSLNVGANHITDGSFLTGLAGITSLYLGVNQITDWSFLAGLPRLASLDVGANQITDGSFLAGLAGLTSLGLTANRITNWSFLAGLQGLTSLGLAGNRITDGSFLAELPNLTLLNLRKNEISNGSFLVHLSSLTSLNLRDNQITDPGWLSRLPRLRTLDLRKNRLSELPRQALDLGIEIEWRERENLPQSINVARNPFKSPPPEIVRQGHVAIVSWFEAIDAKKRPLNEVKVILVGDGGAGKTSLRKRLMGEPFNPKEPKSHGVLIHDWDANDVRVHFWDFGGQEIMHATHQFFLSQRSLYLVVLDGRREEDAEYWLKHVQSFGGDSPVLVVLNKIDENPTFDANRPLLTGKYPAIRDFFKVSCKKKRGGGIAELKKRLKRELARVEMARSPWPGAWFDVKQKLEDANAEYISYEDFQGICKTTGIPEPDKQQILVRFLNDLGTAIHFEDPRLRTTQVLNPRWVTQAVYRIINADQLAESHGVLELGQLDEILRKTDEDHYVYPAEKHGYIVDLMKKFELCYELAPDRFLLPDLLPVEQPDFDFPTNDVLHFRFEYDFLPRSVMPRFIVNEHEDIEGELRWRTGVVLTDPQTNCRAAVKADVRDRTISIEVAGGRRREYFAGLRRTFRKIHDSFTKLDVSQKVPLPDEPDHAVDYEDLLFHEEKGRATILVGELRKEYSVRQLLDGIETERDRAERKVQGHYREHERLERGDPVPRIEVKIGDNATFNGDFAVGEMFLNSFNKAQMADTSDEIRALLVRLHEEMATIAGQLPPERAKEAAQDLETFTQEATKENPRRKWWELSAEGIMGAAQSVGQVGATAITLVEKLTPLLG